MIDADAYAPLFACPHNGSSGAVVRKIAAARLDRAQRAISRALSDGEGAGAGEVLRGFLASSERAWRPEIGLAPTAHRTCSAAAGALQLAATLAGLGGMGTFEVSIESPLLVYLDGWVSTVEGACVLVADGHTITLSTARDRTLYVASDQRWVPVRGPVWQWTSHASGAPAPRYVARTGFRGAIERFPWITPKPERHPVQSRPGSADISIVGDSCRLINENVPAYSPWLADVAAGCALLDPSGRGPQSASSSDHPGLIAIEPPDCPIFCGEMLVHECAHQQLLAYASLVPLVRATDRTAHSPIKGSHRPLLNVLFGGHAVGNMLLYYLSLRRCIVLDARSEERFKAHCTWFEEDYRVSLDHHAHALTSAGHRLWSTLCGIVDEHVKG